MAESSGGVWRGCTRLSTRREASTRADHDSGSDLVGVDEDEVDDASPEVPLSSPATSCPNPALTAAAAAQDESSASESEENVYDPCVVPKKRYTRRKKSGTEE